MFVKATVHGLCIVKPSHDATPHKIYPVIHLDDRGNSDHSFVIKARKKSVDYRNIPKEWKWWVTAGGIWTCKLPMGAKVKISKPDNGQHPQGNPGDLSPVALSDLHLKLKGTASGTLGEFSLPRPKDMTTKEYEWVDCLGTFRLPCKSDEFRKVADSFVWIGEFSAGPIVTINYHDGSDKVELYLKADQDFGNMTLEIVCENLGTDGRPFDNWASYKNSDATDNSDDADGKDCGPDMESELRFFHIDSPSCPPIEG